MRKRHWSYQGEKNRNAIVRAGGPCQIAGVGCTGWVQTADHITPKILGGPDVMENLRGSCYVCNSRKGRRATEETTGRE